MRAKVLAVLLASAGLTGFLGGCEDTTGKVVAFIDKAQQAAVNACGFLPFATGLATLAAQMNPAAAQVTQAASEAAAKLCEMATKTPTEDHALAKSITLNGVEINGIIVKPKP